MQQESFSESLLQNINTLTKDNKPENLEPDNIIQVISNIPSKLDKQKNTENEENQNTYQKLINQECINKASLPVDIMIIEPQKQKIFMYAFEDSDEDPLIEIEQKNDLIYYSLTPSQAEIKRTIEIMSVQFQNTWERIEKLYNLVKSNSLPNFQSPEQKLSEIQVLLGNTKKDDDNEKQFFKYVDLISIIPSKKPDEKKKVQQNNKGSKVDKITKNPRQTGFFVMKQTPKIQSFFEEKMFRKKDDSEQMKKFLGFKKQKPLKQIDYYQKQLEIIEESLNRNEENIKVLPVKPAQFYTNEQKQRFIQKRMVAKAFVRKGYGLNNLRKELQETPYNYKFDQNRYKTVSYGMATDTFRRLEQFLQQYCKNTVYRLQKLQMRPLYSILLNCRDNFPQQSVTFIKFVQIQFNIECQYMIISRREATKLYEKIINQYRIKDGDFKFYDIKLNKNDRNTPLSKVFDYFKEQQWSPQSDYQLLEFYKTERNVSKVRDKYRQHYGPGTQFEDCKIIKSRLNKALRAAIRKVKSAANEARQYSEFIPFLNTLNNDRIKKILISPDAIEARVYLCDVYSCRNISSKLMEQVVIMMEDSIRRIQKKRLQPDYDDYDF